MLLNLTDLSDEPLQSQIIRQIRAKILAGNLEAGMSLPSIRALAKDNRVSVITTQRAYEALMREGLIHSRRGKGFFVSEIKDTDKKKLAKQKLIEELERPVLAGAAEGLSKQDILSLIEEILSKTSSRRNRK
jgi:GntR family transcriptional regulator